MKLEDSILGKRTQLQWFKECEKNSNYFHVLIRGRERRLNIHRIQNDEDTWLEGDDNIAKVAYEHFEHLFNREDKLILEEVLNCLPRMVKN